MTDLDPYGYADVCEDTTQGIVVILAVSLRVRYPPLGKDTIQEAAELTERSGLSLDHTPEVPEKATRIPHDLEVFPVRRMGPDGMPIPLPLRLRTLPAGKQADHPLAVRGVLIREVEARRIPRVVLDQEAILQRLQLCNKVRVRVK